MDFILFISALFMSLIETMKHEMGKFNLKLKEILLNQMVFSLSLLERDFKTLVDDVRCINLFEDLNYLQEYLIT